MATRPDPHGGYWTRKITNNAASALLVYAALQIVATNAVGMSGGGSLAGFIGIAILVGLVIPAVRWLERRWRHQEADLPPRMAERLFQRDRRLLWAAALLLPFAWTALYVLIQRLAGLFTG